MDEDVSLGNEDEKKDKKSPGKKSKDRGFATITGVSRIVGETRVQTEEPGRKGKGLPSVLSERIKIISDSNVLPLFFNSSEYSVPEIAEIISELSALYQEISGDPLVIRAVSSYELSLQPEPELVF